MKTILDDGRHYMNTNGVMFCQYHGRIGQISQNDDDTWSANTLAKTVIDGVSRLDAIVHLWQSRNPTMSTCDPQSRFEIEAVLREKMATNQIDPGLYDLGLSCYVAVSKDSGNQTVFQWFDGAIDFDQLLP